MSSASVQAEAIGVEGQLHPQPWTLWSQISGHPPGRSRSGRSLSFQLPVASVGSLLLPLVFSLELSASNDSNQG